MAPNSCQHSPEDLNQISRITMPTETSAGAILRNGGSQFGDRGDKHPFCVRRLNVSSR